MCFCKEGQPDCSYKLPSIQVTKGEIFSLQVVAVDQVNHTLDAKIIASTNGYLGEGQQFYMAYKNCTKLQFNLYSFRSSETLRLYANGSCSDSEVSQTTVVIKFTPCVCPTGFERAQPIDDSRCECTCNLNLLPHIDNCNSSSKALGKTDNSWVDFTNLTDPSGYIAYPYCLYDYCHPFSEVVVNLNIENGADVQCNFNCILGPYAVLAQTPIASH